MLGIYASNHLHASGAFCGIESFQTEDGKIRRPDQKLYFTLA